MSSVIGTPALRYSANDSGDALRARDRRHVANVAVDQADAVTEAREPRARADERFGIGVDAEQAHVRRALRQHRLCVTAHAHRPVDHPALAPWSQQPRDLVHEDGNVNR